MEKIKIEKIEKKMKTKRHAVTIQNETYFRIIDLQTRTGQTIEYLVEVLLNAVLDNVEVTDD